MSISKKEVLYVADLARIAFDDDEVDRLSDELSAVLDYAETLNQLDTSNVKPTEHILKLQNVFRKDEVKESLPLEKVFRNAPEEEAGGFKVPRVVE